MNEIEKFREFLEESFGDGVNIRELRLSNDETEYIKRVYPKSNVIKNQTSEAADGKMWYRVSLKPLVKTGKEFNKFDLELIRKENTQLKRELETLKKMALLSE